ncbi:MAG TPA: (2Fe-2S)-binding protein [Chloroflexota bacterium]|nr:(2Fe-2S)-binding protein [Chloroflexota bacterium]
MINGSPETSLLEVLRDHLGLTGAKYGCGEGQCGACVVLLNGQPAPACITPMSAASGQDVTTVEGLADGARLHTVQQAFVDAEALQCGYCTPGMIVAAVALLRERPRPTDTEITTAMRVHLCRCGAYGRIMRAIHLAADRIAGQP